MTEKAAPIHQHDFFRILPGILVSLVALVIIFTLVDWQEALKAITQANFLIVFLGLPVYLISYVFRSLAWRTLLKEEVPFKRVFLTMQAGYLLNNVLPFRLGELGRAFLLGRNGLGFWRVFSTILIERAFDMILAAGLLLGTMPFVLGSSQSKQVGTIVISLIMLGMISLHLLARYQSWVVYHFEKLGRRWEIFAHFGVERLQGFFNGLTALVQLSRFLRVLFWMLLGWGSAVVYHYILLRAFVTDANILWAAFGLATASLGVALPSSPSYIGVVEAAWIGAFSLFFVPPSTALAYALLAHLLHIVISCIFGIYALAQEGESLGQLYIAIRKRRFK